MPRVVSDLDPFSEDFRADPYVHYAELRALGRVVYLEKHNIFAVSHYDLVKDVLSDHATYSNAGGGGLTNYFIDPPWRKPSIILEVDPPEHTRTRVVLNRVFSRAAIIGLKQGFDDYADSLFKGGVEKGAVDGVADLVQPFPLKAFGDAIGIPPEDRGNMLIYGSLVFGAFRPKSEWHDDLMSESDRIIAWVWERCQRAMLSPGGFGAAVYEFADKGDITEEEAALLVRSMLSAGVDTTVDSIGLALKCLVDHPDQWRLLRDDPSLAKAAFEEATRYDSSSQSLMRTTLHDTELEGVAIPKYSKVMCFLGSAGRDPAQWESPDLFDIRRSNVGQMGYGVGVHSCVAQMLARLEGEAFFAAMSRAVDDIELNGAAELRVSPGLRGLKSLPLKLTGKAQ